MYLKVAVVLMRWSTLSGHSPALHLCFSMLCNDICPGLSHNLHCLLKTLLLARGEAHYQKISQIADTSAVPMERGAEGLAILLLQE